jgi:hypothetical protein
MDEIYIEKSKESACDESLSGNTSEDSSYGGVYEGHLPIIGYV